MGARTVITSSCVFCDIILGAAPASIVYADDLVVAFMDIQPVNSGHLLLVPRAHVPHLADLDEDVGSHLFRVGMRLAGAVRRSRVRCEGVNLFLADGEAAGQEVFHAHLHIIPRFRGDGLGFSFSPDYYRPPGRDTLDEVASDIRKSLED
jgi:histidine triad (HIT) family protein